ncbi:UDP-N-acetylmuramate--L-alanine ligase [Brumimicrobium aurantiacum]|uniref:UDP-N-acetylmuramate--L-alanine ligase n=1 Tax=Brumimicrobium aurantiacum TaxID=1737063 RepID=A0A3E1EY89_9FLAO|nr:UDP-N-acetylmuramate--L-alanine ligase [Brumimicrobium aurantiacum]RFC54443.1 UDP-N-acetylmuramate--L-alanine ligase [Brumimicrobium aurantiacum]
MKMNYSNIYFIGIGGIGMSALARYFNEQQNIRVTGYDKTETKLTRQLKAEGIEVHYRDLGADVNILVGEVADTLIVVTPAVPSHMKELKFLQSKGYKIKKRAEVLGEITADYKTLAVAGTHGKTTTSTMLAHVLSETSLKCNAFLGGISANFNSNLLLEVESPWMVVEADEYDRSFHQLSPYSSIITSTDADHLDIYNTKETLVEAFEEYSSLINPEGKLIVHHAVAVGEELPRITYGIDTDEKVDYKGSDLELRNGNFQMTVTTPNHVYRDVVLGLPGIHNAENALSVIALCESIGMTMDEIRPALMSFKGVKRRFEVVASKDELIYIDDYAHHPTAIDRLIDSVRLIYKDLPIYVVFQPHLFSRTKDFMSAFGNSLSKADQVFLLPIYPAREEPIPGVTSEVLAELVQVQTEVLTPENAVKSLKNIKKGVILTVGAGNIDQLVTPISELIV